MNLIEGLGGVTARQRLPVDREYPPQLGTLGTMVERVKVTQAVRRTGVPGTVMFLAIRHGELASEQDDRGYDWVDPDEVASLTVPH